MSDNIVCCIGAFSIMALEYSGVLGCIIKAQWGCVPLLGQNIIINVTSADEKFVKLK